MPPRTHARLAPSSAYRWSRCAGSIHLIESLTQNELLIVDDAPEEYTLFGIAGHLLAERWLNTGTCPETLDDGTPTPEDMREVVRPYVEYVENRPIMPGGALIERRVSLAAFGGPQPIWGTPDAQLRSPDVLEIADLKTGYYKVRPERNEQLILYAAGALTPEPDPSITRCLLTIVQPRAGGISTWESTPEEILRLAREIIGSSWDVLPNAPLTPGAHCRFCPAQGHCPALKTHASVVAQMDFDVVPTDTPPSPETLSIEVAADMLTKVEVLDNWFNALRTRIVHELERGREVPGWKLVSKRPRRTWTDTQEVLKWAQSAGIDGGDLWKHELISPAGMESLVGKHVPRELYASVSSGLTLVRSSDSRPAAAIGPQEEFGALPPVIPDAVLVAEQSTD